MHLHAPVNKRRFACRLNCQQPFHFDCLLSVVRKQANKTLKYKARQIYARFGYQRFHAHATFFALEKMQKQQQQQKPNQRQKNPMLYAVLFKTGNLWTVYES